MKQQLELINSSKTTELQQKEFKKFAQFIKPENEAENNKNVAKKLTQIYFEEAMKHPAKSTIQR